MIIPVLCLLVAGQEVMAQHPSKAIVNTRQIPIEYLGTNDGLSQGLISAMAQDSDGFIWLGTKDGLNRYDGYTFKVYRYQMSDSTSMASSYITALYVDEANRLWIGTETQGVYLFDRATETFIHMQPSPVVSGALRGRSIGYNIWGDRRGHIIVARNSLPGFDVITVTSPLTHTGKETYTIKRIEEVFPDIAPEVSLHHPVFCLPVRDGIWCMQDSARYFPLHPRAHESKYVALSIGGINQCSGAWMPITDSKLAEVYLPRYNELLRYDETRKKFTPILTLPPGYAFGCKSFMDRKGRIWNIQSDNTFLRIDVSTGIVEHLDPVAPLSVSKYIRAYGFLMQDKYDNIWMGSPGMGAIKISAGADLFKRMPEIIAPSDSQGTVWPYRTARPGSKADTDTSSYHSWQSLVYKAHLPGSQILPDAPKILVQDTAGALWAQFNTSSNHLYLIRVDPVKQVYKVISSYTGSDDDWRYLPIIPDSRGGIWYGERGITDSAHLFHIRAGDTAVESYTFPVKNEIGASRFINDWYEEKEGTLWYATRMGVFSFHPDTKHWQHYGRDGRRKGSLSFNQALCICPDPAEPSRYMWIGTEGGGLNKLDRSTGLCTVYTMDDGLPNDVIYAVQSDGHDNLWISTNNGLCLFDPRTTQSRHFSTSDGLPGNEFNRFQFSRSASGILCFGGVEGTVSFDPEDFYTYAPDAKMVFTQLRLFNKSVRQSGIANFQGTYRLAQPIEQATELTFPYDQRMISLSFALLELSHPEQNKYRYKLEGLNEDWIDNDHNHEVTLTNLPPGSYTLRVAGESGNGRWSAREAVMHITILHPWWATWWFRAVALSLILAILYAFYQYRLRQALKLERMRNRIAQDLHDEIGSTLSSISLYSAVMERLSPDMPPATGAVLRRIRENTSQMMESMNDIVWTIKADNDSFEQVVDRMRGFAVNMTEARNIELHFDIDRSAEQLTMNMDQRKNIYLIFKEAVNNAVKYAACSHLRVHIAVSKGELCMSIQDDGVGFDEQIVLSDTRLAGGNGLHSMRLRATNIGGVLSIKTGKDQGTKIVLVLPM